MVRVGEFGGNSLYFDDCVVDLYDLQFGGDSSDVPYYLEMSGKAGGDILELACGTGRLLIPSLQAGNRVDGLDYSPFMLERLRRKLGELGLDTELYLDNMVEFSLPKRYSLILIPVCSFLLLESSLAQLSCLRCCREHLLPGGRVALDFSINSFGGSSGRGKYREFFKEVSTGEGSVHIFRVKKSDPTRQVEVNRFYHEFYSREGYLEKTIMKTLTFHWLGVEEFCFLAESAGFSEIVLSGGYGGESLTGSSRFLVSVLG